MNELYFLTAAAKDTLDKVIDKFKHREPEDAFMALGELKYILDMLELEQEQSKEEPCNGSCRCRE